MKEVKFTFNCNKCGKKANYKEVLEEETILYCKKHKTKKSVKFGGN